MSASIAWVRKAAMTLVGELPIATCVTPCGPQPRSRPSSCASQSVSEPALDMPIFLPLSSSTDLTGESQGTAMPMKGMGGASLQIARTGAPLADSAISGPAPTPMSMLPALIAWTSLLPPVKSEIFTSSPCLAKMPSLSPTLTGRMADAFESALPTLSVVAAKAGAPKMASAARNSAGSPAVERAVMLMRRRALQGCGRPVAGAARISRRGRAAEPADCRLGRDGVASWPSRYARDPGSHR